MSPNEAAARTIFLNKTCFNGLYRLNKKGMFNTSYGQYKNPTICDEMRLRRASCVLQKACIICGDYLEVLQKYAKANDFIFLDPPYMGNFTSYTKEQFYEKDHINLAKEIKRLQKIGCYVILTNSNHPLVHELYKNFKIDIVSTKRSISSNGNTRMGEDVIITAFPKK